MQAIQVYLCFDGTCREAMEFYRKTFGGELQVMTFGDGPADMPAEFKAAKDRVLHAHLATGKAVLMASDSPPGQPVKAGDAFWASLAAESIEEVEAAFRALSEGGQVVMAMHDAFWGARFGMVVDRFGVNWMLSAEQKKPAAA